MATQRRGRDPEVTARISQWALAGWTPAEIHRELDRMRAAGEVAGDAVPTLRTIQRDVKEMRTPDTSGTWHLSQTADPGSAFVLATLADVVTLTKGRVRTLTKRTAAWLQAIHLGAEDLDPWPAFELAMMYGAREERDLDTTDLDMWLAFGPWRSRAASQQYEAAVAAGYVPTSPMAVNYATRVILAAAALADADSAQASRDAQAIPRTTDGHAVDPEIYDQILDAVGRHKVPIPRQPAVDPPIKPPKSPAD